jgi:hypothetical protein
MRQADQVGFHTPQAADVLNNLIRSSSTEDASPWTHPGAEFVAKARLARGVTLLARPQGHSTLLMR